MNIVKKYFDLDSRYRDRKSFPNPSQFIVPLNNPQMHDKIRATDPVADATPVISFQGAFNVSTGAATLNTTGIVMNGSSSTQVLVLTAALNSMSREKDFYRGAVITFGGTESHYVVEYKFLDSSDRGLFVLDEPISQTLLAGGTTASLTNPTNSQYSAGGVVFLPTSVSIDNYYSNYYLHNTTLDENYRIVEYDGVTATATLEEPTANPWLPTHDIVLRLRNSYVNKQILAAPPSTLNEIPLDLTEGNIGDFVRVSDPASADFGEIRKITRYDKTTQVATLESSLSTALPPGTDVEILAFSKDNLTPLQSNASLALHQEVRCYEIELTSLVLPNAPLKSGGRIHHYPYVYVEFRNNNSPVAMASNILYSNSLNSKHKLFKIPLAITDITSSDDAPYVKVDGIGASQIVKFKPTDEIAFGVYLPGGRPLETRLSDNVSPMRPNPLLQISAVFSVTEF